MSYFCEFTFLVTSVSYCVILTLAQFRLLLVASGRFRSLLLHFSKCDCVISFLYILHDILDTKRCRL